MGFSSFMDEFKSVAQAVCDAGNHELYARLQELSKSAYELQIELLEKKEENTKLLHQLNDESEKTYENQCYYFAGEGPYCSRCYDVDGKKVRMFERDTQMGKIYNSCPNCKHEVIKSTYPFQIACVSTSDPFNL